MKKFIYFFILFILADLTFPQEVNITLKNYRDNTYKTSAEFLSPERLKVKVTFSNGEPIENLSLTDFELKVRNNSTEITKVVPLSEQSNAEYKVVLCLDNSSSMENYKDNLIQILEKLVSSLSKSADITVVFFDIDSIIANYKFHNKPLNIFSKNFKGNDEGLISFCKKYYNSKNLTSNTYLYDQLYSAFNNASGENKKDVFYIILSDGEDNSSETDMENVMSSYKSGKLFAIDFSDTFYNGSNFLKSLANKFNGEYFNAKNADDLANYFSRIAKKIIFSGYEITYKEFFPPEISSSEIMYLENNSYKNTHKLKIEEVKSNEFYPLLNYVFFDKNSAEIPQRYSKLKMVDTAKFKEERLSADQLEVYHNLLNIIGSRLKKDETINVKLIGCNDNEGVEKNNLTLSKARAQSVKDYLVNIWGISPSRIIVKGQNLPQKPSNTKNIDGQSENKRVEIISDKLYLLDPVEIETDVKQSEPGNLQIHLDSKYSSTPESWELVVQQHKNDILNLTGKSYPPPYIAWNINESIKNKEIDSTQFEISILLRDKKGLETKKQLMKLPIEYLSSQTKKLQKLEDKNVEKLSLVLFDFNSSALSKRNQDILLKAKDAIQNISTLRMIGYTDSIGTESSNTKLSQLRASNALKELIKLLKPGTKDLSSEGYGELVPLYDNGTPEVRFYNRACQLIIETPIIKEKIETN